MTIFKSLEGLYLDMFYNSNNHYKELLKLQGKESEWSEEGLRIYTERKLKSLCTNPVSRRVFLAAYKKIEPIPVKDRIGLYRYVIGLMPELTNPEKRQEAEIIYTIGNLIS